MTSEVRVVRGALVCVGPAIEFAARSLGPTRPTIEFCGPREARDGPAHHITIATKDELRIVLQQGDQESARAGALEQILRAAQALDVDLLDLGLGSAMSGKAKAYFKVILWPAANRFRARFDLPPHDFHITVGFNPSDCHNISKGITSLLPTQPHLPILLPSYSTELDDVVDWVSKYIRNGHLLATAKSPLFDNAHATPPLATGLLLLSMILPQLRARAGAMSQTTQGCDCALGSCHSQETSALSRLLCLRSMLYEKDFQFSNALDDAREAALVCPCQPLSYARMAPALVHFGQIGDALAHLHRAQELNTAGNQALTQFIQTWLRECGETIESPKSSKREICIEHSRASDSGGGHSGKYPSTPHLPFSPAASDPKNLESLGDTAVADSVVQTTWVKSEVVVTEKLDGANCCLARGLVFARSHAHPATHASFGPIRGWYQSFSDCVPENLELFGENMFAIHSIEYNKLAAPFLLFAVRDSSVSEWLSWEETEAIAQEFGIPIVPVVFRGVFTCSADMANLMESEAKQPSRFSTEVLPEGFVVRVANRFTEANFARSIAKFVRRSHIQTGPEWRQHWRKATILQTPSLIHQRVQATNIETPSANSSDSTSTHRPIAAMLCLVGLPGSGKSTFAKQLVQKYPDKYSHLNQDEIVSKNIRASLEDALGTLGKQQHRGQKKCIILDRCNATAKERAQMIELAFCPSPVVAIFFDATASECIERVKRRANHPTIPHGKGQSAVTSFAKILEPPSTREGFDSIICIRSFAEANQLLVSWGGEPVPEAEVASSHIFKFPRTHHIVNTGGSAVGRDDLVLHAQDANVFCNVVVSVEEKVDGANLGFSLTKDYEIVVQNRSHTVTSDTHGQFSGLKAWQEQNAWALTSLLVPEREILFGEWLYARHSIHYTRLPGYFIAFDIFDKSTRSFCSVAERNRRLSGLGIPIIRAISTERKFASTSELVDLMMTTKSLYCDGFVEGVYVRVDDDVRGVNLHRGKIVRPDFIQNIETHWSKQKLVRNKVDFEASRSVNDDDEVEQNNVGVIPGSKLKSRALPALPPIPTHLSQRPPNQKYTDVLAAMHRGPTQCTNWIVPGVVMAGDAATMDDPTTFKAVLATGITTLVCLQTKSEIASPGHYRRLVASSHPSIKLRHFPIVDQNIAGDEEVGVFIKELLERLEGGEVMYIHCRGGHGRTGTICSILLGRMYGLSAREAMWRVQAYHDVRERAVFVAKSDYEFPAVFPNQIEQIRRLLDAL
eukprot:c10099_g1_i1.p1 GENE.c10099_g1_i1~~c10099_g1_i1.p1  ORF type:complete len:1245 (+),score=232.27 c10099_g1_i1:42-3776(+)